ncbi:neurofibromin [Anaeramoeba flamelloides]|uniref:Neurofibromin n=1 Tax=Anaeramoeba flamelloides TaxID=1746091 RepID=A0AAV7ZYP8_9EUKA|nr:neurofibromin [Anaeramoeba flamelloides]
MIPLRKKQNYKIKRRYLFLKSINVSSSNLKYSSSPKTSRSIRVTEFELPPKLINKNRMYISKTPRNSSKLKYCDFIACNEDYQSQNQNYSINQFQRTDLNFKKLAKRPNETSNKKQKQQNLYYDQANQPKSFQRGNMYVNSNETKIIQAKRIQNKNQKTYSTISKLPVNNTLQRNSTYLRKAKTNFTLQANSLNNPLSNESDINQVSNREYSTKMGQKKRMDKDFRKIKNENIQDVQNLQEQEIMYRNPNYDYLPTNYRTFNQSTPLHIHRERQQFTLKKRDFNYNYNNHRNENTDLIRSGNYFGRSKQNYGNNFTEKKIYINQNKLSKNQKQSYISPKMELEIVNLLEKSKNVQKKITGKKKKEKKNKFDNFKNDFKEMLTKMKKIENEIYQFQFNNLIYNQKEYTCWEKKIDNIEINTFSIDLGLKPDNLEECVEQKDNLISKSEEWNQRTQIENLCNSSEIDHLLKKIKTARLKKSNSNYHNKQLDQKTIEKKVDIQNEKIHPECLIMNIMDKTNKEEKLGNYSIQNYNFAKKSSLPTGNVTSPINNGNENENENEIINNKLKKKKNQEEIIFIKSQLIKKINERKKLTKIVKKQIKSNKKKQIQIDKKGINLKYSKNSSKENLICLNNLMNTIFSLIPQLNLFPQSIRPFYQNFEKTKFVLNDRLNFHINNILRILSPTSTQKHNKKVTRGLKSKIVILLRSSNLKSFVRNKYLLEEIKQIIDSNIFLTSSSSILKTNQKLLNLIQLNINSQKKSNIYKYKQNQNRNPKKIYQGISSIFDCFFFVDLFRKKLSKGIIRILNENNLLNFLNNTLIVNKNKNERFKVNENMVNMNNLGSGDDSKGGEKEKAKQVNGKFIKKFYSKKIKEMLLFSLETYISDLPDFNDISDILNHLFVHFQIKDVKINLLIKNKVINSFSQMFGKMIEKSLPRQIFEKLLNNNDKTNNYTINEKRLFKKFYKINPNCTLIEYLNQKQHMLMINICNYFIQNQKSNYLLFENFASRLFSFIDYFKIIIPFLQFIIFIQIELINNSNELLNKGCLLYNLISQYTFFHCKEFFIQTLGKIINKIYKKNINFKANFQKKKNDDRLKLNRNSHNNSTSNSKNTENIKRYLELTIKEILKSHKKIPETITYLCYLIKINLKNKFPKDIKQIISRFIFHNFFCVAIENPHKYAIIKKELDEKKIQNYKIFSNLIRYFALEQPLPNSNRTKKINKIFSSFFSDKRHFVNNLVNLNPKFNVKIYTNLSNKQSVSLNNSKIRAFANFDEKIQINKEKFIQVLISKLQDFLAINDQNLKMGFKKDTILLTLQELIQKIRYLCKINLKFNPVNEELREFIPIAISTFKHSLSSCNVPYIPINNIVEKPLRNRLTQSNNLDSIEESWKIKSKYVSLKEGIGCCLIADDLRQDNLMMERGKNKNKRKNKKLKGNLKWRKCFLIMKHNLLGIFKKQPFENEKLNPLVIIEINTKTELFSQDNFHLKKKYIIKICDHQINRDIFISFKKTEEKLRWFEVLQISKTLN